MHFGRIDDICQNAWHNITSTGHLVRSSSRTLERLGPDAFFLEVALAMAYYGAACILSTMMCLAYIELRYRVFGDYECIHWTTTAARNG